MSFCVLARNIPKGIGLCTFKSPNIVFGNKLNLTKLVSQKQFTSFNQLPRNKNIKQLLSQAVVKNKQALRNASTDSDHRKLWTAERAISLLLLGVVPYGIISPNAVTDNLMAVLTVAHIHWGLEAVVVDYVRPLVFGPVIPKVSLIILYVISAATLGGLLYYNFTNIGIGKTIKKGWNPKSA
ncbi:succinate dehydrogenase [ubiquinone] cytochrome b small subunit, mitochondrial [Agrilus planipennis]|uniref:Succinate dehydrogenase [ubiquinone] cytochrome b small subunit n=1 Tax=Agrilus planipennis TaxID=224129 RepID=A0A1W4XRA8_AGRPL|nr:succinate dehydrogenase [ubiquinone] cytochrome b small subunit, mitochondrial [Agrilus planipennis]XP_025835208.1 succinate dehydrogenase [ubiquinone] cytochrome b small subunit, mitochondrial [Agrilus planipennis]